MILEIKDKKERILSRVTEEVLFVRYAGTASGKILCPFHKERSASLSVDRNKFKCFGCGISGDVFKFIGLLYNIGFNEVLNLIESDYGNIKKISYKPLIKYENNINWKISEFSDKHLDYWSQYNIDKSILNKYKVYPLSFIKSGGKPIFIDYKDNLAFIYMFKLGWKIYLPQLKSFYSNRALIQGLENIDFRRDSIIITKAYKDVMFLHSIDYNAIAVPSENTIISLNVIEYLKKRFKRVIVNMDSDQAGIRARESYSKMGLGYIECPNYKDFTDMCKAEGFKITKELINQLCQQEQ